MNRKKGLDKRVRAVSVSADSCSLTLDHYVIEVGAVNPVFFWVWQKRIRDLPYSNRRRPTFSQV